MPVSINESVTVTGVVTNAKQGLIKFDEALDGSETFRSATVNRFPDGTRLEMVFRLGAKNQRQMVRAIEIKPTDRFHVAIIDLGDEATAKLDEFATWLSTFLGFAGDEADQLLSELNGLSTADHNPVDLAVGLSYDDARNLKHELSEGSNGSAIFELIKHTKDDMPAETGGFTSSVVESLEWVEEHWIQPSIRPLFLVAANAMKQGGHLNYLLTGPSGYGKTSLFDALARWLGYDMVYVNCATTMDAESWFGFHEARGGDTVFIPTPFTEAVRRGRVVILLDETNRVEPWLSNSLFPLLDHRRATFVHGEEIICGPGVIFGGSVNVGAKYAGTHAMDEAFKRRWDIEEEVIAPPREIEERIITKRYPGVSAPDARKIVGVMDELRKVVQKDGLEADVSPRTGLKMASLLSLGLTIRQAARYTIINPAQPEDRKPLLDVTNSRLGIDNLG